MRPDLSAYLLHLQSKGQIIVRCEDAEQDLGMSHRGFLSSAERMQKQNRLVRLRKGLYVVVPPQFMNWGAPPPTWYVDALMRHEGCPYYVGLLKASELLGASHQAVLEFQVVTEKRLRTIDVGRTRISFYYRKDIECVVPGVKELKTDTGSMKVSSAELTALDLLKYPHASAGLDNILTVLSDLAKSLNAKALATLSASFEKAIVQRLGHLLDRLGYSRTTEAMQRQLTRLEIPSWVELDLGEARYVELRGKPVERDKRWNVVVRRVPELDE